MVRAVIMRCEMLACLAVRSVAPRLLTHVQHRDWSMNSNLEHIEGLKKLIKLPRPVRVFNDVLNQKI